MKTILLYLSLFAAIATLSSCASGWHKQGVSDYETENALAKCEYEQGMNHVSNGAFVTSCMKSQGFRWY